MKNSLNLIFLFVICCIAFSCVDDSDNAKLVKSTTALRVSGDEIEVGYIDEDDNFIVDEKAIADIQDEWNYDYKASFTSFNIVKKNTIPDPSDPLQSGGGDSYYMLIGKTTSGVSVGMRVKLAFSKFYASLDPELTVSCGGCNIGCDIDTYIDKNDQKKKYWCSNPCSGCTKTETLTNAPQ